MNLKGKFGKFILFSKFFRKKEEEPKKGKSDKKETPKKENVISAPWVTSQGKDNSKAKEIKKQKSLDTKKTPKELPKQFKRIQKSNVPVGGNIQEKPKLDKQWITDEFKRHQKHQEYSKTNTKSFYVFDRCNF